ncbi:hypothetical protein GQ602_000298 [Ophiocordyceps camponoti-floridani]|uniref:Uncharacterized protein n=1 Tax=Ophiocordyceps camponoti-floridani TaxID=2030778 RepID=A0A8H4QBU2_9HYPO|nr:hypothetical protein GQ602_000298 [Ophiocordyceps camponoti-floridani]
METQTAGIEASYDFDARHFYIIEVKWPPRSYRCASPSASPRRPALYPVVYPVVEAQLGHGLSAVPLCLSPPDGAGPHAQPSHAPRIGPRHPLILVRREPSDGISCAAVLCAVLITLRLDTISPPPQLTPNPRRHSDFYLHPVSALDNPPPHPSPSDSHRKQISATVKLVVLSLVAASFPGSECVAGWLTPTQKRPGWYRSWSSFLPVTKVAFSLASLTACYTCLT